MSNRYGLTDCEYDEFIIEYNDYLDKLDNTLIEHIRMKNKIASLNQEQKITLNKICDVKFN